MTVVRRELPRLVISGENGRRLAGADLELIKGSTARAVLYVEAGHLPPDTRARLVDAVFSTPQIRTCRQAQVTLPVGDTEILDRVRQRCPSGQARSAGTTCLFDADLSTHPGYRPVPGHCGRLSGGSAGARPLPTQPAAPTATS